MKTLLILVFFAAAAVGWTQQPAASPEDVPRSVIRKLTRVPSGDWLFTMRVYASKKEVLYLTGPKREPVPGGPVDDNPEFAVPDPFSLNGSTLTDEFSGKTYANLSMLPSEPFVGPMEILTSINPGGWVQMGLAFPAIPPPPLDKEGKKQPYRLLFSIPKLKIETRLKLDPDTLQPLPG